MHETQETALSSGIKLDFAVQRDVPALINACCTPSAAAAAA
jgi:hypothetical protein